MVINFKFIRKSILFILFSILLLNCNVEEKKKPHEAVNNAPKAIRKVFVKNLIGNDSLKEAFIQKELNYLRSNPFFKSLQYSSTGIHIDTDSKINYSLGYFNSTSDKTDFLIFLKKNKDSKICLDILSLKDEKLLKNDNNRLSSFFCYKDGKQDEEIIAIAEYEEEKFLTKILKAWRADRKTEKIIEIPVDGIKVENMDYGF
ncbi:hypothetical protein [Cellulophaga sp. HaHa_2_1]|uniref:hypothetical protein n=1 Tax=Cellulophaga sp. HaHa_2_1 TaxID=2749994 RepID=UPI001C4E6E51|nr:hypothetical protein [Cellulophaga sp. HaHa_2_1]QXP53202.1 hypothetical protein H0I24_04505 [Cellulophaga sp. HaHa_2_1]